ncbi:WD40 repeat-like protein [Linderina pennispora]|uniref:WD40 repeat-like protein n=1 Tax=Linderina pennispora TaxID=61395 RepID=A0A1Y1W3B0_9FUNG|nr:WD40 repeat-like protein [Linderina pennispora]ORX68033.1 WD40 repeat-like protein [Linderina pennispora]
MPANLDRFTCDIGFPVGCIGVTSSNEVVLGGGGGPGGSGVKNKLSVYKVDKERQDLDEVSTITLSSNEDAPTCLAVHPKEKTIVSSVNVDKERIEKGENANCRVFKLAKKGIQAGKAAKTMLSTDDMDYQKTIAIEPHGRLVANGSSDGTLAVVEYPSLKPAFPFVEASGEINDVDFNASGKWLVVATDHELKVLASKDGSSVQNIDKPHTTSGEQAVFRSSRFGRAKEQLMGFKAQQKTPVMLKDVLYTVLNTRSRKQAYIAMWNTQTWQRITTRPVCRSAITTFAVSNKGRLLAFATASLQIGICDAHTLRVLVRIPAAHSFAITCAGV